MEDFHTPDHSAIVGAYDKSRVGGLKYLGSKGNYDYEPNGALSTHNYYIYGSQFYDLNQIDDNALGGQGDAENFRWDTNGDNIIYYDDFHGNFDKNTGNEMVLNGSINGQLGPYYLGTRHAFLPNQKLGMMTNPGLIPHLVYDKINARNSVINTHGLSVQVVQMLAGDVLVVRVSFDDTEMLTDQRWTGDIALQDVPNAPNGVDLLIPASRTLTIDKSGTVNRHTLSSVTNDFINLTTMTCRPGTLLEVAPGGTLLVKNSSTMTLMGASRVDVGSGALLRVESGSTLIIENNAELVAAAGARIEVGQDAKLIIRSAVAGNGLRVLNGADLKVTGNGQLIVETGARLDWLSGPTSAGAPRLVLQHAASEIVTHGLLTTAANVPFTFGGQGLITFDGAGAALNLGANSAWVQSGPGRPNVLYRFRNGAIISVQTPLLQLEKGKLAYDNGGSLEVNLNGGYASLNLIDLASDAAAPGYHGLVCRNLSDLSISTSLIHDFGLVGLAVENCGLTLINSSYVRGTQEGPGMRFTQCPKVVCDRGYTKECHRGVELVDASLFLRNRYIISDNVLMGIETSAPGGLPNVITVGDEGCAWIINNGGGIVGQDTWLDIDAFNHQTGSDPQINRFDGNTATGGFIFDICYTDPNLIPPTSGGRYEVARGNYWGTGAATSHEPVFGVDYQLVECGSLSQVNPLNAHPAVDCEPLNCAGCEEGDDDEEPGEERIAQSPPQPVPGIELSITLAPNPAHGLTTLGVAQSGNYHYRVVTSRGETVATGAFTGQQLSLPTAWPTGAYRVVVWRTEGAPARASRTLVVE